MSVRRSLVWMTASQGTVACLQFGGSVVIARLLTPYEMGVYAVAAAIAGIINAIRTMGLTTFLVREPILERRTVATAFTINLLLALIAASGIMLLSGLGGIALGEPGVQQVLILLAFSPVIAAIEFLPAGFLERSGAFHTIAVINMIKALTATAITVALALEGFSYMSMVWGFLGGLVSGAVWTNILGRRYVAVRVGLHDWRRVMKFGMQMLTIGLATGMASRVTDILLGRILGLAALGLYSRAQGLNSLLWENLHLILSRIVFVDFAERHRRSLPLRDAYLRILAMITGLLWPAFGGMAIFAGPIILTVYGPQWVDAALPLSMLSIAALLMTSVTMASEIYLVAGEMRRLLRYEVRRIGIGISLFTAGCFAGLGWAAAARVGEAVAIVLLCKRDIEMMTETTGRDYVRIYCQSAVLTALACSPSLALMFSTGWANETPLLGIGAAIAVGVVAWVIGLGVMRHPLYVEARGALQQILSKYIRSR